MSIHDFPYFILAGILLNLTPGPDMALFGSRAASQGFLSGASAFAGVCAGCLIHTLAAALGLSAILMTSANAFFVVKLVGAAYLVYVGISMLRESAGGLAIDTAQATVPHRRMFMQGFLTNVLNPKVAIFFLAFLPQFIDTHSEARATAFLVLGLVFIVNSTLVCLPMIWLFARSGAALRGNGRLATWINRGCGALFVGVGIKLAFSERPA